MTFQVCKPSGAAVMGTAFWSCVPSKAELEDMNAAGYIFKLDGKRIKLRELIERKESELRRERAEK